METTSRVTPKRDRKVIELVCIRTPAGITRSAFPTAANAFFFLTVFLRDGRGAYVLSRQLSMSDVLIKRCARPLAATFAIKVSVYPQLKRRGFFYFFFTSERCMGQLECSLD